LNFYKYNILNKLKDSPTIGTFLAFNDCAMCPKGARIVKKAWLVFVTFIFLCSAALAESDLILVLLETPLPAAPASPLQGLDLIPVPAPEVQDRYFPVIVCTASPAYSGQKFALPRLKASDLGDSIYNASLISLAALNAADYFSTLEALKSPGVEEKNHMLKSVIKDRYAFAAVKIGSTDLACYGLKTLYKKSRPLAWALSIASNLACSYVVSNNFRIINRCKTR
jgi:hypothetical protein